MRITTVYLLPFALGCNGITAPVDPAPRPAVIESLTEENEEDPMLTAVLLATVLAASGDVETILAAPAADLDGPMKTKLGTAITGLFSGADVTKVKNFNCSIDREKAELSCDGMHDDRVTDSEFIDLAIAGKVSKVYDTAPEGFVDFKRHAQRKIADATARVKIDTFVQAAFAGITMDIFHTFRCTRNPKDDTKIGCQNTYYDTLSPPTYMTMVRLKAVVKTIRRVP